MKKVTPLSTKNRVQESKPARSELDIRKERYGDFAERAHLTQKLLRTVQSHRPGVDSNAFDNLPDSHKEAISAILGRVARIVNGNSYYAGNWQVISDYAKLIESSLPHPGA